MFTPKRTDLNTGSPQADINIFTVASGLLYEVSSHFFLLYLPFAIICLVIAFRVNHDS